MKIKRIKSAVHSSAGIGMCTSVKASKVMVLLFATGALTKSPRLHMASPRCNLLWHPPFACMAQAEELLPTVSLS